jgi:hypothetical protein
LNGRNSPSRLGLSAAESIDETADIEVLSHRCRCGSTQHVGSFGDRADPTTGGEMMEWETILQKGETLCWEGRPAPRAYVFRNWKHSFFGIALLPIAAYWQIVSLPLASFHQQPWLPFIPLPLLLIVLYLCVGHLLVARLEWEKVFYAVTDRRLLIQKGLRRRRVKDFSLSELTNFRVMPLGHELAGIRVNNKDSGTRLTFTAFEQPQQVIGLLEQALVRNGYDLTPSSV